MGRSINPHPKIIKDEYTGTDTPNHRYDDWESGYKSGVSDAVCSVFYEIAAAIIHEKPESSDIPDRNGQVKLNESIK